MSDETAGDRRFTTDPTWDRHDAVVLAGSPLRLFRLTSAGVGVVDAIEAGVPVAPSRLIDRLLDAGAIHPIVARRSGSIAVTTVTPQLGGSVRRDGRVTVDDGSEPPLAAATVRLEPNAGPAAARNAARSLVTTPVVAFLDADVEVEVDMQMEMEAEVKVDGDTGDPASAWFTPLLAHFDDPRVGLVAPRVTGERGSPLDLGNEPARIRAGSRVSYVPGAALVVRVEALDSIGWFDETLRFGEDVDLVWRLDEAGWWCRYDPTVTVWHEPRPSLRARLRQHADYGTSAAPLALRHPHALAPFRSNGWTAAVWTVAVGALQPGLAAILAVGSALALGPKLPDLDRRTTFGLAMRGHLLAGRQLAEAVRRAWWPVLAVASIVSRPARLALLASMLAAPRDTPTDLAYGWGVWRGVVRHRTARPLLARISAWPARRPASRQGLRREPRRRRGAGVR